MKIHPKVPFVRIHAVAFPLSGRYNLPFKLSNPCYDCKLYCLPLLLSAFTRLSESWHARLVTLHVLLWDYQWLQFVFVCFNFQVDTAVVSQIVVPVFVSVFMWTSGACYLFKRMGIKLESKCSINLYVNGYLKNAQRCYFRVYSLTKITFWGPGQPILEIFLRALHRMGQDISPFHIHCIIRINDKLVSV